MKIAGYLKQEKITQGEFAKRMKMSQQIISLYVNEKAIPPRSTALRIVEVTKGSVTLEDLWGLNTALKKGKGK